MGIGTLFFFQHSERAQWFIICSVFNKKHWSTVNKCTHLHGSLFFTLCTAIVPNVSLKA